MNRSFGLPVLRFFANHLHSKTLSYTSSSMTWNRMKRELPTLRLNTNDLNSGHEVQQELRLEIVEME